jgi:hypothetical protein
MEMGDGDEKTLDEAFRIIARAGRSKADRRLKANDKAERMDRKSKSDEAGNAGAGPAAKRAAGPSARTKSRLRIFEWQATKGTRVGWLSAIEREDFEEVKRLSLADMKGCAPNWQDGAKAAEASASWINSPLPDDVVAERDLTIFLRRHPGHPEVERCVRLHAHLCATPLELAMVMGKERLLRAIEEEWARGRRHRDGRPLAPRWGSSAGPKVKGWHRLGGCGDARIGFDETGVALGENLFLWAYMNDRAAYRRLVRMGFCEDGFLRGFFGELRTVESAEQLLRSFGRPKGRNVLNPDAVARFVEMRKEASWNLRQAVLELEQHKDRKSLAKVKAALAKSPFVKPGCLHAAANAESKEILVALLDAGANPNGWIGGAICDWSGAIHADAELHGIWMAHGGNPFLPGGSPLRFLADSESVMAFAVRHGRALAVEAFLRMAGEDWPLTAEDAERLAHLAERSALEWPHLASALAIIARLLREEPRRAAATREREALASSTEELGRASSAHRL